MSAITADARAAEAAQLRDELARLRRENQRLARETEHFRTTARIVRNELDTHALAKALAQQSAHVLSAERASIALIEQDELVVRATHTNGVHAGAEPRRPLGKGLMGWVARHNQPRTCNDAAADPEAMLGPDCRNAMCVPIVNHQNHVFGVIEVRNKQDGRLFVSDDMNTAQALAVQAAVGLDRALMFDRMTEWAQSLETLLAFNAAINEHLNPVMLVRRLIENAARFLKAGGGLTGLAVPGRDGVLAMVSDAYWHAGRWHERPRTWLVNHGLPGFMLVAEFPYIANAYAEDKLADPELVAQFDAGRALCVPIKDAGDQVLGFFELHKAASDAPFTWQDAAFLESLGNTTAVAIRNAQLLKALEAKNEQIQALSADHLTRLEDERRRIARELHDEAGQMLIGIKLGLQVLGRKLPAGHPEVRDELDHLREQVNESTSTLRDMARRLRPPTLDELGLAVALRQLGGDYQARTGIDVNLDLAEIDPRLPQIVETALYRIAQEALTNAAKHARAGTVWVSLAIEASEARLSVVDDGCGFDASQRRNGLGLLGMKERVDMLNGSFTLDSRVGEGTQIMVSLPLAAGARVGG